MPTAQEFELAAAKFEQAAEMLRKLPTGPKAHFGPDVLTGGTLTSEVGETITELTAVSLSTAILAEDRAETCRERAKACRGYQLLRDQYERDLAAHEENLRLYAQAAASGAISAEAPVAPTPPPPPPPWVELD